MKNINIKQKFEVLKFKKTIKLQKVVKYEKVNGSYCYRLHAS